MPLFRSLRAVQHRMHVTGADNIEHCKQHLASLKKPKAVRFREATITQLGKILKSEIGAAFWKECDRKI